MKPETQVSHEPASDEELVRNASRDPAAFRPLYEKYYRPLFVFVHHRTADKQLSADIVSQVFLKALTRLEQYKFRGLPFSSWLYRIAINECNSYFRRHRYRRTVILEEHHADEVYEEMFGDHSADDLRERLPSILVKLRPFELQIIELRFLEGRPFKEVADILNISETYAKVRTYRVLDKMKKMFLAR